MVLPCAVGFVRSGPFPVTPRPPVFIVDIIPYFRAAILFRLPSAVACGFGSLNVGVGLGVGGTGIAVVLFDEPKKHICEPPILMGRMNLRVRTLDLYQYWQTLDCLFQMT
jgi:hypothetical protein